MGIIIVQYENARPASLADAMRRARASVARSRCAVVGRARRSRTRARVMRTRERADDASRELDGVTMTRERDGWEGAFATIGRAACAVSACAVVASAANAVGRDGRTFDGAVGAPSASACGTMSEARVRVARRVMMCNQANWREDCLDNYDDEEFSYVDGPGLTKIQGKRAMERYLKNQFDFSKQFLTVQDEVCEADAYVATWRLDMLLGTGPLRNVQGMSVLKFVSDDPESTKIRLHRDVLPDGVIFENAPVVGPLVRLQRQTYTTCIQSDIGCAKVLGGVGGP